MSEGEIILRDVCERIDYGFTASANENPVGAKFLRITDIVPRLINWDDVPYCEISDADRAKYALAVGDIVIARTGATSGWAKQIKQNVDCVFASYLVRLRIVPEVDAKFIGVIVESENYKQFVHSNMGGSAQPQANAQILTSYPLRLPPLAVQRKIAGILSAYDDLIETNTRRIALLEAIAQEVYREWFVRLRFPGHHRVAVRNGVPDGWAEKRLDDIAEFAYGKALKEENRIEGDFPVLGSSGVVGTHNSYLVEAPGIVIGRKGNVGSVHWVDENFFPIDTAYYVKSDLSLHYLFYLVQSLNFLNNDAAVPGLNRSQAYANAVLLPTRELITKFAEFAADVFSQKKTLGTQNRNLAETRDALLSRLLSGKIDVANVDVRVPGHDIGA